MVIDDEINAKYTYYNQYNHILLQTILYTSLVYRL